MTLPNNLIDRGKVGNTPALLSRADETYADFMRDTRNLLLHEPFRQISALAEGELKKNGVELALDHGVIDKVREVSRNVPEMATFLRVKRSAQEIYKQRIIESYNTQKDDFIRKIEAAEKRGPGTLTYDPDFIYPAYATVEIHIQPDGYTGHPLAGLYYDYGTSVFFGDGGKDDVLHKQLAAKCATPKDGKVTRILDVATSIGQLACELKKRFPDAEVHGIDISSAMLRYAHWRALEQNTEIHLSQMASEDMEFENGSFDLITSHLLFHEIPVPVIKKTLSEIRRLLRPGGTYVMFDFPTATPQSPGYGGFAGLMDAADNGEPYAYGFVKCGIEELLEEAGLKLRSHDKAEIAKTGRVCDAV
ncbi:MAG: class I SAM-dependent methyltransferase [Rhodospirillaceae bacterium]|nr:class I SAM-dependent methyltransferase [Rhodospirillaceae bacterium]